MNTMSGGCYCGNIRFELGLSRPPAAYNPRACDCDFCTKHGAAWLSDAQGALTVRVQDANETARYRQGSGQAEFLLCTRCGVLTGVFYNAGGLLFAAVNARAVGGRVSFGPEQMVSPKTLSAGDKAKRWQDVWFSKVHIGPADV